MSGNSAIAGLKPESLWNSFASLNAVPRASKKEEQVTEFARQWGESRGLKTKVDEVGNVLICKPGTKGMESAPPVVMQAHLDMVHQQNAGTNFDFENEGIKMVIDGDWVHAKGTTLGADNGIGVASIMAILESTDIAHPPIEALFTIDEETGMTGAKKLRGDWLTGKVLLNLDTEDDTELTIGCAGGVDVTLNASCDMVDCPDQSKGLRLSISGLTGGHSGMDIHLGRGNANKLMNRVLSDLVEKSGGSIASVDGGGLRNAIPRESVAVVVIPKSSAAEFMKTVEQTGKTIAAEYHLTDPGVSLTASEVATPTKVVEASDARRLIGVVDGVVSGIWRMSPSIPGLVQTSNNLARVIVADGKVTLQCLTRSNVDSERDELSRILRSTLAMIGGSTTVAGDYPGWQPEPESGIVKLMTKIYESMFDGKPHVSACHAGLECGIIGSHYPGMEMISFGPNIRGAHSPDEKVQISSVQKFWKFLIEILAKMK